MWNRLRILLCLCALTGTVCAAEPQVQVKVERSGDAFVIDATTDVPVPRRTAWDVLTDLDHMVGVISNLTSSKILTRNGNDLRVAQEGTAKFGIFTYSFVSEREIRLEPMKRIVARQVSGNARRFESVMELAREGGLTRLHYHAELVPDSGIARLFGGPFVEHEIEEELQALVAEMTRRSTP